MQGQILQAALQEVAHQELLLGMLCVAWAMTGCFNLLDRRCRLSCALHAVKLLRCTVYLSCEFTA